MKSQQGAVLASMRRVQSYMDANGVLLKPVVDSTGKQLVDSIDRLTHHAVSQDGGARGVRGETAKQRALRHALRFSHMRPVADVARLRLREVPDFTRLTMPPAHTNVQRLLTAAEAMAEAATPYAATMVENGLPSDFLAQLRLAADAVTASLVDRGTQDLTRSGGTAGLASEERRARVLLRVLDSAVTPLLAGNDQLLAEWKAAKQVRRKSGPPAGGSVTPAPTQPKLVQSTAVPSTAVHPTAAQPAAVQPTTGHSTVVQPTATQPSAVPPASPPVSAEAPAAAA